MNDPITPSPSPKICAAVPAMSVSQPGSPRALFPTFSWTRRIGLSVLLCAGLVVPHHARAAVEGTVAEKDKRVTPATPPTAAAAIGADVDVARPRTTSFAAAEMRTVDNRRVLMIHPPCRVEWALDKNMRSVALVYGFDPPAYERGKTNGAELILQLVDKSGTREIFHRLLRPIQTPSDRGAQHSEVTLPPFGPGTRLVLQTTGGEYNDTAWDWVYLASFRFQSEGKDGKK